MNSKKSTVQRSRDNSKFQEIISVGKRLFVEHGSDKFSLRLLAKELGMSHVNLYNYVESKRELWIAIRRYDLDSIKSKIEKIFHNFKGSYVELLEEFTIFYLNYAQKEYRSFQMLFSIPVPKSKKIGKIEANYVPIKPFELVKEVISKGIESGEIQKNDPEYLSYVIFSLIHGATTMELEFRMKSNILEPIGTLLKENGLEEYRLHILDSLRLILGVKS